MTIRGSDTSSVRVDPNVISREMERTGATQAEISEALSRSAMGLPPSDEGWAHSKDTGWTYKGVPMERGPDTQQGVLYNPKEDIQRRITHIEQQLKYSGTMPPNKKQELYERLAGLHSTLVELEGQDAAGAIEAFKEKWTPKIESAPEPTIPEREVPYQPDDPTSQTAKVRGKEVYVRGSTMREKLGFETPEQAREYLAGRTTSKGPLLQSPKFKGTSIEYYQYKGELEGLRREVSKVRPPIKSRPTRVDTSLGAPLVQPSQAYLEQQAKIASGELVQLGDGTLLTRDSLEALPPKAQAIVLKLGLPGLEEVRLRLSDFRDDEGKYDLISAMAHARYYDRPEIKEAAEALFGEDATRSYEEFVEEHYYPTSKYPEWAKYLSTQYRKLTPWKEELGENVTDVLARLGERSLERLGSPTPLPASVRKLAAKAADWVEVTYLPEIVKLRTRLVEKARSESEHARARAEAKGELEAYETSAKIVSAIPEALLDLGVTIPATLFGYGSKVLLHGAANEQQEANATMAMVVGGMAEWFMGRPKAFAKDPAYEVPYTTMLLVGPSKLKSIARRTKALVNPREVNNTVVALQADVARVVRPEGMEFLDARSLVDAVEKEWAGRVPSEVLALDPVSQAVVTSIAKNRDVIIKDPRGTVVARVSPFQRVTEQTVWHGAPNLDAFLKEIQSQGYAIVKPEGRFGGLWTSQQLSQSFMAGETGLPPTNPGGVAIRFALRDVKDLPTKVRSQPTMEAMRAEMTRMAHSGELEPGIYPLFKEYGYPPKLELEMFVAPGTKLHKVEGTWYAPDSIGTAETQTTSAIEVPGSILGGQGIPLVWLATEAAKQEGRGVPPLRQLYLAEAIDVGQSILDFFRPWRKQRREIAEPSGTAATAPYTYQVVQLREAREALKELGLKPEDLNAPKLGEAIKDYRDRVLPYRPKLEPRALGIDSDVATEVKELIIPETTLEQTMEAPPEVTPEPLPEASPEVPYEPPYDTPVEVPPEVPPEEPPELPPEYPTEAKVEEPVEEPLEGPIEVPSEIPPETPLEEPLEPPLENPLEVPLEPPPIVPPEERALPSMRYPPHRRPEAKEVVVKIPEGSIAWRQGEPFGKEQIKYIPPPFNQLKPISLLDQVPAGWREKGRTPEDSIQIIGSSKGVPSYIPIDLGVTDAFITVSSGVPHIEFKGGGLNTDVGKRIPGTTKGMSISREAIAKVEEEQARELGEELPKSSRSRPHKEVTLGGSKELAQQIMVVKGDTII